MDDNKFDFEKTEFGSNVPPIPHRISQKEDHNNTIFYKIADIFAIIFCTFWSISYFFNVYGDLEWILNEMEFTSDVFMFILILLLVLTFVVLVFVFTIKSLATKKYSRGIHITLLVFFSILGFSLLISEISSFSFYNYSLLSLFFPLLFIIPIIVLLSIGIAKHKVW